MKRATQVTGNIEARQQFPKRQVKFPGLINAAQTLGVHRIHLYLVLTGQRKSKRLMARYAAYKASLGQ